MGEWSNYPDPPRPAPRPTADLALAVAGTAGLAALLWQLLTKVWS